MKKILLFSIVLILLSSLVSAVDDFNRANNNTVGNGWTETGGTAGEIRINDNTLEVIKSGTNTIASKTISLTEVDNLSMRIKVTDVTSQIYILLENSIGTDVIFLQTYIDFNVLSQGTLLANVNSIWWNFTIHNISFADNTFNIIVNDVEQGNFNFQNAASDIGIIKFQQAHTANTFSVDYITINQTFGAPPSYSIFDNPLAIDPETEDTLTQLNLSITTAGHNLTASDYGVLNYSGTIYAATLIDTNFGVGGNITYAVNITTPYITINNSQIAYTWYYNLTINASDENTYTDNSGTQNLLYVYPRLNITRVYNLYTNNSIVNFSGNYTLGASVYNFSTSNNFSLMPLIYGVGNYTVYVEADGYAISNSTNYKNLNLTSLDLIIYNETFGLYTNNSVLVNVYNEDTFNLITANVTLTVSGNSTETVYIFSGGSHLVESLVDGLYNFKFVADNFTSRTYVITVAEQSFQNLAAYLTPTAFQVILTYLDYDSSATLEGVSIAMSRLINSSWSVVESKTSDITGRAQFSYIQNVKYRFYSSITGYSSKTFDLDPVLFSSYNVRLNKIFVEEDTLDYADVFISFAPKKFYNDAQNNFSIFFAAPTGVFVNYNYDVTFPTGSIAGAGSNAVGENFEGDVNISGATFFDTVNISYCYNITIGSDRCFNFQYAIRGAGSGNYTFADNEDGTFGMGIFERVLIVTAVAVLVGGIVGLALGSIPALVVALFIMGLFTSMGFYPQWLFLISAFVGVVLIIKSGS